MGVTVFSCPSCEAVFSVHPAEPGETESKAPVENQPAAAPPLMVPG